MPQSAVAEVEIEDQPSKQKSRRARQESKPRRQPPYAVVLHNDDKNGMDFVVGVLKKVFGYSTTKAIWLMLRAHTTGQSHVWTGCLEVAELKADQLRSCGADPSMVEQGATKLHVSLQPLQ